MYDSFVFFQIYPVNGDYMRQMQSIVTSHARFRTTALQPHSCGVHFLMAVAKEPEAMLSVTHQSAGDLSHACTAHAVHFPPPNQSRAVQRVQSPYKKYYIPRACDSSSRSGLLYFLFSSQFPTLIFGLQSFPTSPRVSWAKLPQDFISSYNHACFRVFTPLLAHTPRSFNGW